MKKKSNNYLVWMDLEMTGLDVNTDTIIEIATIITDEDLNIIDNGPNLAIFQPDDILNKMDDWNTEQHTKSGLLERVKKSKLSIRDAEKLTLSFIEKYCEKKNAPLCGNSIGHDKTFLRKYMPEIVDYLHYRIVDVSSFKEMIKRWYPKRYSKFEKKEMHLALDDIKESIGEMKYYKAKFFIPE